MNATEVTEVCRLCPSNVRGQDLLHVFDEGLSLAYNMKEVILVTTGVGIHEHDLISKKICQRCCNITLKMFQFRQDALKQDRKLKEKLSQYLGDKGIKLPNSSVTIKKENHDSGLPFKIPQTEPAGTLPVISTEELRKRLHPTVANVYKNYPDLKLPKRWFDRDIAPFVSLTMGEVEDYFKTRKLDIRKFIYKESCSKIELSNKVAKKKTSYPTKQISEAPLKISKELFGNNKKPRCTRNTYVCTPINKKRRGRKRKMSLADTDKIPKSSTTSEITELVAISEAQSSTETFEPEIKKPYKIKSSLPVPKPSTPILISTLIDSNVKLGEENSFTNISETTSGKPEFIELLGLTPRIVPTKSQKLLVCNLCGSVHNNTSELKRHTNKHMVCQFCKQRFRSVEAKENHIDNMCKVKEIMNSLGPVVALEKVHLNLDIRKKYNEAFFSFDPIPGLVEPAPLEHVLLESLPEAVNDVIVLSDIEESSASSKDPLSDILTPSADMPAFESREYKSVPNIRPDMRIKNNTVLKNVAPSLSDKELVRALIDLTKQTKQPTTCENMSQTNLPINNDITKINSAGTCEFKNLVEQLVTYKIPVTISKGPFNAVYQFKKNSKRNKSMALWDDLPITDVYKKSAVQKPITPNENKNYFKQKDTETVSCSSVLKSEPVYPPVSTNLPIPPMDVLNSHVKSASSIVPDAVPTILSCNTSIAITSNSLPTNRTNLSSVGNTLPINSVNNNNNLITQTKKVPNPADPSISSTTLLQNYDSSSPPLAINKSTPVPRTYVNSSVNKNEDTLNRPSVAKSSVIKSRASILPLATNSPRAYEPVVSCTITRQDLSSVIQEPSSSLNNGSVFSGSLSNGLLSDDFLSACANFASPRPVPNVSPSTVGENCNSTPITSNTSGFEAEKTCLPNSSLSSINTNSGPPAVNCLPSAFEKNGNSSHTTPSTSEFEVKTVSLHNGTFLATNNNFVSPPPVPNFSASIVGSSCNDTPPSTSNNRGFRVKNVWELQ